MPTVHPERSGAESKGQRSPDPLIAAVPSGSSRGSLSHWQRRGLIALIGVTLVRAVWSASVGLTPQEAYYWQYGRHPALSYLDHPAMSAWWIRAGCALFGTRPFGVRVFALCSGVLLTLLLYRLAARLFSPAAGLWAAALANATVLFEIGATVVTPDVPLLLFWSAACLVACELLLDGGRARARSWYLLGALVGLALLSKYTAALLFPSVLLACVLTPRGRAWLRSPHPYLAVLLALALFSPVLIWNAEHHFVSFAFQTTGRLETVHGLKPVLVGRYVGLQAAALGPVGFFLLGAAAIACVRRARKSQAFLLLGCFALPSLLLFTLVSPFHWVKMNWPAPAYVGLWVAAGGLCTLPRWRLFGGIAAATGALLALLASLVPLVPQIPFSNRDDLISGWAELAAHVAREKADLVVGADYKTASELAFDLPGRPFTASQELFGGDGLMYGFWTQPEQLAGKTLLVVSDRRNRLRDAPRRLAEHCGRVDALPSLTVHRGPHPVTSFDLTRCVGYRP